MNVESLRQEIAELKQQVEEIENFANGIQRVLLAVLPYLLRDHHKAGEVAGYLKKSSARYDELLAHPERADAGETVDLYEAAKMLYRTMGMIDVWPDSPSPQSLRGRRQAL